MSKVTCATVHSGVVPVGLGSAGRRGFSHIGTVGKDTVMSDLVSWDFEVSSRPPESARKGGPGRQRSNPFDEPLMRSYNERFWERTAEYPKGRFFVIRDVPEDKVEKVKAQIRNAARYNNIGSRIDVGTGKDAGVIAFRGTVPTKGPNAPGKAATGESAGETVTNDMVDMATVDYGSDEDEQY